MLKLRPYQKKGVELLRESFSNGNMRTILYLATGGGKTATFTDIVHSLFKNNKKVLIVIRRRELIFQTANSFEKFTGHRPSVIMGSEKGFNPKNPIQVCSIDTISRRIDRPEYDFLIDFDFLIVDEAHDSTSPKYRRFLELFDNKFWIGFTATPFETGKKYLEETGWQDVVQPIESRELRDQGYLVKDIAYAPAKIDTSGIKTTRGDFDQRSLAERASESKIVGDIVSTYKKFGENRPAILFAVNKEHSRICAEAFRQAGIAAKHQDESHTSKERHSAIEQLKRGEIKILCNVNIFSTGVDIPQASCGIFARPTKSEILYVQQVGRLLRPYKKCARCSADCGADEKCPRCGSEKFSLIKNDAILLDHANNCERFGLAFDSRPARIKKQNKKNQESTGIVRAITCIECYGLYHPSEDECPYCGHKNEVKERQIKHEEGELRRIEQDEFNISRLKRSLDENFKKELRWNLKPAFKYFQLYKEHGEIIFNYSKELGLPKWLKGIVRQKAQQGSIKTHSKQR